jgi:UDP-3-O-[3-hydroxymyristoyl] glucosamine N-acyltransferase
MFTAAEIAKKLDGQVQGDGSVQLTGFAPATVARAGDLTFAENETFFGKAEQSAASAILIDGPFNSEKKVIIRVPNARIAFARVLPLFFPEQTFAAGIHPSAIVAASAQIDASAHVGPYCVIGERAKIGPRVILRGEPSRKWLRHRGRLAAFPQRRLIQPDTNRPAGEDPRRSGDRGRRLRVCF